MMGRVTRLATVGLMVAGVAAAWAVDPQERAARRTLSAQRLEEALKRREELMNMSPEARATFRAERQARRAERDEKKPPKPMEIRAPLPLPMAVTNTSALIPAGQPVGGVCPGTESCQLKAVPPSGRVLILTAVWSATRVVCDQTTAATPRSGAPIAPGWRCERELVVEGPGAGYTAYLAAP